jgi:predicted transcriptional regulator
MNYVKQIRGFWRAHEEHLFSATEIAVYFYLLEVCNICRWKNIFKRNNAKIEADLGISFNTLKNARNRLAQAGLMSFKTTNGNPNVLYTLSNFDEVTDEVTDEISKTKHKQNETKQEGEGTLPPPAEVPTVELPVLPDTPTTSEGVVVEKPPPDKAPRVFKPPTVEEVSAYCAERKNDVDPMRFVYFYQSKGWLVGKTKMQDWKAAVRTWENRDNMFKNQFNLKNHGTKPDEGSGMLRLPDQPNYETKL